MLPLTLTRHSIRFYLVQGCLFLFLSALGINISWRSVQAISSAEVERGDYLTLTMGLGLLVLALFTVIRYFKNSPIVSIDSSTIRFGNNEVYQLCDIKDVKITGKIPFPLIFDFPMEGTTIHFKDGTRKLLYDEIYTNAWQLKSFLDQVVVEKKAYKEPVHYRHSKNIELGEPEFFKGNPLISFSGIMVMVMTGFLILMVATIPQPAARGIFFIFAAPIFIALAAASSMNYFGIAGEYLVVRHHFFVWKRHYYKLDDIKEIVFEQAGRSPNILRLISHNFNTHMYAASSLWDKDWLALMARLQANGVVVRNECINLNK